MLEVVGGPDLWHVLNGSQGGSHDAQEVGPEGKMRRQGDEEDASDDNHDQSVENTEEADDDSSLPRWRVAPKLFRWDVGILVSEENEEQDEAVRERISKDLSLGRWLRSCVTYMRAKQSHWTPSCATPSSPAAHSKVSSSLQQPMALREGPTVKMLANPAVAEVVPRRTKYGEMPSAVPREMIR